MSKHAHIPFWEIGKCEGRGFKSGSSQTDDFKIDTCHFTNLVFSIIRIGQGLAPSMSG